VFCQLETLRHCLPPSVRITLEELPESLDETYERILKEIKKPNKRLAQRVLQCLVVAIRPLRVAELAEVLAVDFDDREGIPRSKPDWRWDDQEEALVSACSSLIAIIGAGDVVAVGGNLGAGASDSNTKAESDDGKSDVEAGDSRVVQFSHFSVKEFLTSARLATASGEVSNYHIDLEPAHTILGQACLAVLLEIQNGVEGHTHEDHPLARYAAEHCTTHAQFGEALSRLQKGMEYLFDADKPHFRVWLTLYDMDTGSLSLHWVFNNNKSPASPLYYAALYGFHNLVEHLISKYPHDVNADGGCCMRPILAALARGHFETADLLRHNGADPHIRGVEKNTPLHSAVNCADIKLVQKLLEYDADINAVNEYGSTPLQWASRGLYMGDATLRLLLKHGADVNARDEDGSTPLHEASKYGELEVARLLLEYGADVEAKDNSGRTASEVGSGYDEFVKFLRERVAE
jgi:Ankyrin repeats (3 copies)